jgi:hypothetical protein
MRLVLPRAERHGRDAVADHPVGIWAAIAGAMVGVPSTSVTPATALLTTGRASFIRNGWYSVSDLNWTRPDLPSLLVTFLAAF